MDFGDRRGRAPQSNFFFISMQFSVQIGQTIGPFPTARLFDLIALSLPHKLCVCDGRLYEWRVGRWTEIVKFLCSPVWEILDILTQFSMELSIYPFGRIGCRATYDLLILSQPIPVADLHSKILDVPPPPECPNSFNFMQFLGNFGKIVCWSPPPPGSWRPTWGKSWIRHCILFRAITFKEKHGLRNPYFILSLPHFVSNSH